MMRRCDLSSRAGLLLLFAVFLSLLCSAATANSPASAAAAVEDLRWQKSIEAFGELDKNGAPPPGGIVFVGSSSIRLWGELESEFRGPDRIILNRGFGGARMSDCTRYLERVVIPYRPRLVLVYAGDNDLAEGRAPAEVFEQFSRFVQGVREALPAARIGFISVKPSPAREALLGRIRETNRLVLQYAKTESGVEFIDVFTPMLDAAGRPRRELFRADALHLNRAGYALWKSIIAPHLR